ITGTTAPKWAAIKPRVGLCDDQRELVDNPDRIIRAQVEQCQYCHQALSGLEPEKIVCRQVTELSQFSPVVIETRQHKVRCPHCQCFNRGCLPEGLEAGRYFGPRLEATVVFLKHQQHLSCERIVRVLSMIRCSDQCRLPLR